MVDHICKRVEYQYKFYNNRAGGTTYNELTASGNGRPQWNNKYNDRRVLFDDTRQLNDLGVAPEWTKLGVMFREQSALRTPE